MPDSRVEGGRRPGTAASTRTASQGPLVSVITSVLDGEAYLENTIQSVARQSYPNVEHIVVDGGSTDGTLSILRAHSDALEYWVSEPDNGIYDAWNKGLAAARGDWIAFVGADDVLRPNAMEQYVRAASGHAPGSVEFISSRVELVTATLERVRITGAPWGWPALQRAMVVAHVGAVHHRSLFAKYGNFDTSYRLVGDHELLLRARGELRSRYIDTITASMRVGGASSASTALRESIRAKHETGGRPLLLCHLDMYWWLLKCQIRNLLRAKLTYRETRTRAASE